MLIFSLVEVKFSVQIFVCSKKRAIFAVANLIFNPIINI